MSMSRAVLVRAALVVILAGVLTGACEKAQLLAPTASTLTLTSGVTLLTGSGSTVITAFVAEKSGTPVQNGTTVRFTTTLGRLEQSEAQTRNGAATTTLFAEGASGVAVVTAASGSAVASGTGATGTALSITMGSAAVESVTLAASPATVSSTGGTVTLTVTPVAGTAPSVSVTWGDGGSSSLGIVSGARSATHAYSSQGVFTITASATEGTETFSTSTSVTVGPPPSVVLAANVNTGVIGTPAVVGPPAVAAVPPTTFVFTVTPAAGVGARTVTLDFGDTQSIALGAIAAATQVTHRYTTAGVCTVRVTETDTLGNVTTAVVVITVTANALS